jgi:mRNA-degrading endonuclease RelE of RelBE toxin-antitoxin system
VAYRIELSPEAVLDLQALRRFEGQRVRTLLPRYLAQEPSLPSHTRKVLDPNPLDASWELRLGDLRAFYAIDEPSQVVRVLRIGRKEGNQLFLRGVPVEMRL